MVGKTSKDEVGQRVLLHIGPMGHGFRWESEEDQEEPLASQGRERQVPAGTGAGDVRVWMRRSFSGTGHGNTRVGNIGANHRGRIDGRHAV